MKKTLLLVIFVLGSHLSFAQRNKALSIQETIHTFFDGFHSKDSVLLQSTLHKNFDLGSVFKTQNGVKFQQMDGLDFISAILSRPEYPIWKEVLGEFEINISGQLANAWVPYEFWLDDAFSHCGANSIHLIETEQGWKILNITDSRLITCD